MKLHENTRDVHVSGTTQSDFQIANSPKAFRILSDNIYSDKVKAIIREVSTNAYDSHVDAGNSETPFDVHIPDHIEPWFSVRDYGTGMSKATIEKLYTTYFDSNRNDSNDYTGAYGLGSKSPFSYTDSFNVQSFYNGETYIYNCFIDSDGRPKATLLHEGETQEQNGVEVKFAVNINDCRAFEIKASNVFYAFPVTPNFTNVQIKVNKAKTILSGNDWRIVERSWYGNSVYAIQGNVAYPIDFDSLPETPAADNMRSLISFANVDMFFNTGELGVSVSRESLEYDKVTVSNLLRKADLVVSDVKKYVTHFVNEIENFWDARIAASNNIDNRILRLVKKVSFGDETLSFMEKEPIDFDDDVKFIKYYKSSDKKMIKDTFHKKIYINTKEKPLIVVNNEDSERKCIMKARAFFKNNDQYHVLLIVSQKYWKNRYKKQFHNIDVKVSTKIPKPTYTNSNNEKTYHKTYIDITNSFYAHAGNRYITAEDVDLTANHLYITVKNKKVVYNDAPVYLKPYYDFLKSFVQLPKGTKIYAVKKIEQQKKRFRESNWVNIVDFVKNNLTQYYDQYKKDIQRYIDVQNNRIDTFSSKLFGDKAIHKSIDDNSSVFFTTKFAYDIISGHKKQYQESENQKDVALLTHLFQVHGFNVPEKSVDFENQLDEFFETYPLLRHMRHFHLDSKERHVVDYINAINAYRER